MWKLHHAIDRGHTKLDWLDSRHSFSFGDYIDPQRMGFRSLRVINEDHVAPGAGFRSHAHANMEIITCVLKGTLTHRDSLGHQTTLTPGQFQCITAGSGITHSEFNASETDEVWFYQVWIYPDVQNLTPGYQQVAITSQPGLNLVASRDGESDSLRIQQEVRLFRACLKPGADSRHPIAPGRHAWVQCMRGELDITELASNRVMTLGPGDGLATSGSASIQLSTTSMADALMFDLV
ncbi:MAG: pirin family protein [Planctomycetota bacterium]